MDWITVQITSRTQGKVTQEEYDHAVELSLLWVSQGMDREAACELAAHQLKTIAWMRNDAIDTLLKADEET